jgi:hypothetical protein
LHTPRHLLTLHLDDIDFGENPPLLVGGHDIDARTGVGDEVWTQLAVKFRA